MADVPQVFVTHCGGQKHGFVDVLRVLLCDVHNLDVFVDEWSLQPSDDALDISGQYLGAAVVVVVVLSHGFVRNKHTMGVVRQLVQQWEAGSSQRLVTALPSITCEECEAGVLREYAPDLAKLLGITALRDDQTYCSANEGDEARRTVTVVLQQLVTAGQLPATYGTDGRKQLPWPLPLLGRDAVLADVQATLQRERQLFIVGGPGEGKSAVAAEAAHRMSDDGLLPGGVFRVDLAAAVPTGGKAALSQLIAGQLAETCSGIEGGWRLAVKRGWDEVLLWLHKSVRNSLVVLENAESVLCDRASAKALLQLVGELRACPRVSTITVSRIKPYSEQVVLHLPPLDVDSAMGLLRQQCSAQLRPEGAARLVRLCGCNALLLQVLGGVLAAGRCTLEDALSAAEAGGPLSVLQASQQGGPCENEQISQALQWLMRYLTAGELQALASLAMFRGSFSEEAATAVLQPGATAAALLQDLADACLLVRTTTESTQQLRFALHPLVWDLAERTRQVQPQQQQLAALEAFLHVVLACGDRLGSMLGSSSPAEVSEARQLLAEELPNISALAVQLRRPPLCTSAALHTNGTLSRLRSLAVSLYSLGQPAAATAAKQLKLAHKAAQDLPPNEEGFRGGTSLQRAMSTDADVLPVGRHQPRWVGIVDDTGGADLRNPSMDMLNLNNASAGMDDVDKLLQVFQPGQGSFDLPHDLAMDWNVADLHTSSVPDVPPVSGPLPMPIASMSQPQPFAGPVSRLGCLWHTPAPLAPSASTPPLWTTRYGDAVDGQAGVSGMGAMSTQPAMSAGAHGKPGNLRHLGDSSAATRSAASRLRPSVRSASVGADGERPLSSSDLDLGLSGAKAKERNRRAQKRFRERQKVAQQAAAQRVVQLEEALARVEVERSELSQRLKAMASLRGADAPGATPPISVDDPPEQQVEAPAPSSQGRVLTLSVPQGSERQLTGSDIAKLTWAEYIGVYESYLQEMAAMLLKARGNGDSAAGLRLQRLCVELTAVTAASLACDPTAGGRLHCTPLMSQPDSAPLAPPDGNFWLRITVALCLSPQQRLNCLRLRSAHLHKVQDVMQDRYRINDMMQSTLPSYDAELQAARQHLRALQVSENLQRNLRQEQGLQLELFTAFFSQALTPIQMATAATESYPWWPDILAILNAACDGLE